MADELEREYPPYIPDNMTDWLHHHISVLEISWNRTDGVNGYGQLDTMLIKVLAYVETCVRCGFDTWHNQTNLWEKCTRHRYKRDYIVVFHKEIQPGIFNKDIKNMLEKEFSAFLEARQ